MYIHFNLENRIGFWWHEINIVGPSIHLSEFTNTKHQYRLSYCSSSNLHKLMGKFLALFSIKAPCTAFFNLPPYICSQIFSFNGRWCCLVWISVGSFSHGQASCPGGQLNHNQAPMSFSITAAASIRPMTRKMFIRSVTADSSRCLASHRFNMCSVGEFLVAKYWTYLKNL